MSEITFDNVKITSSFDVPEAGGNLVSGETIGKHFGKIAKHMNDESIHHTVDNVLSDTSENPVQNKVIKTELNKKANKEIYTDSGISLGRDPDTDFGLHSIAIGDYCTATGRTSIAIGNQVVATADHAISIGNFTTASGEKSVAMNDSTTAEGANSFAGGLESKTIGNNSFAFGSNVVTNKNNSAAFGTYNKSDENTLFSIGNGDSDTERSNAFEITKTGGKLHDKDIATADNIPTSLPADGGNADTANKLASSSYTTLTIDTTDWTDNSNGGYVCTKTLSSAMAYTNFNIDVVLSTDQSAAKLQIEAWNNVIADGRIAQTTSSGSTTAFTFYAFTNKPSVAINVGIQGVS